ncbi:MAG: methyl-accepting chemotaxis protein [Vallitaleaceae bacterium]|jgi:methyl-accepting chemotaxis protein|nr:methyl-accepting chemotaxis protein [Vallitaleaceae bacterium]
MISDKNLFEKIADGIRSRKPVAIIVLVSISFIVGFTGLHIFFKFALMALLFYVLWKFVLSELEPTLDEVVEIENNHELEKYIEELANSIELVTNGGLGGQIANVDNHQLAKIATSFNYVLEKISSFIKEVDGMSEESSDTSRQLEDISTKTSKVMHELSATLEELTSTTMHLNDSIDEISKGAREINDLSQDGMDKLGNLVDKMTAITEDSRKTTDSIDSLNTAAKQMEGIIKVIAGIAKQTNLLALNAAIEAARAGDAGKGFAVVADEVRKLAGNTQKSLDDISGLISTVAEETTKTVKISNNNNKEIEAGSQVLTETTSMFKVITTNIATIVVEIDQSADAASQIARGSQEIAEAASIQTTAIGDISGLAKDLSQMSTNIKNTLANTQVGSTTLELDLEVFDAENLAITDEVKTALREELGIGNAYLISMIARLEGNKGHKFFIEGMAETLKAHPNVKCIIAGDGSLQFEIERKIKELGLSDSIMMIGYRDDVNVLLATSNLLVATSRKEGIPPRILEEAMASAKPIVSTDVDGAKALIENTKQGLLVPFDNVAKLTSAMNKMIDKPFVAENFGKEARAKIETLYYAK